MGVSVGVCGCRKTALKLVRIFYFFRIFRRKKLGDSSWLLYVTQGCLTASKMAVPEGCVGGVGAVSTGE